MTNEDFYKKLQAICPGRRTLTRDVDLLPYEADALVAFSTKPAAVVLPESEDEVVALVKMCHAEGVPFVARGSGTSLSGGSMPIKDGVVIALNRLNKIIAVDPEQRTAVVQPGVINLKISNEVKQFGLYYAPDPSSQSICTIGGNVAFNTHSTTAAPEPGSIALVATSIGAFGFHRFQRRKKVAS